MQTNRGNALEVELEPLSAEAAAAAEAAAGVAAALRLLQPFLPVLNKAEHKPGASALQL